MAEPRTRRPGKSKAAAEEAGIAVSATPTKPAVTVIHRVSARRRGPVPEMAVNFLLNSCVYVCLRNYSLF
jgi:hypothetical protein